MRRRPVGVVAHKGESIAVRDAQFQAGIVHTSAVDRPAVDPDPAPIAPEWLDDLPLKAGPPWLSMGLHPLDLANWLVFDADAPAQLALKRQLLADRPEEVFGARPGAEEAGQEVLELIQAWLAAHAHATSGATVPPEAPIGPGDGTDSALGHPLDRAGRLVQEDLCLLLATDGRYRLEAASLCFPSHWRLSEKLGRSVGAIHGPVHHYAVRARGQGGHLPGAIASRAAGGPAQPVHPRPRRAVPPGAP